MKKYIELLSPAGNMEKLKAAVTYGADAVYVGGETFGLRAYAGNLSLSQIEEAMAFLHSKGKKGYLTVNAYARNNQIEDLEKYLYEASHTGIDAFIISDPGVFNVARKVAPNIERHISTQANTTNSAAIELWHALGATRVVMARELTKEELQDVVAKSPCEVEAFVHGAICMSYSGRCTMSAYMTGRDANAGECTQSCRWNYVVKEASRPDQEYPIEEDESGTYLFNAKDLCLLDKVKDMIDIGVSSLKIEGRMKSVMYVAVITGVYRKAIDAVLRGENPDPSLRELIHTVSNRHYTEGFFSNVSDRDSMNYETSAYVRSSDFLGVVKDMQVLDDGSYSLKIDCRGKYVKGETLEILTPELERINVTVGAMQNAKGEPMENTRPSETFTVNMKPLNTGSITIESLLRRL